MATNLAIDDRLINRALRVGKHRSKREAVAQALEEYVKQQKRLRILDLEGTVDFRPDWDYKANRLLDLKRIPRD